MRELLPRMVTARDDRPARQVGFAPVPEVRSGFPWSAVDELQDFVGPRNRSGRLPAVKTLDFALSRPWRLGKRRIRAGIKDYNILGATAERDVQATLASPATAILQSARASIRFRFDPLRR